jgi:hypothetical protein
LLKDKTSFAGILPKDNIFLVNIPVDEMTCFGIFLETNKFGVDSAKKF